MRLSIPAWIKRPLSRLIAQDSSWFGVLGRYHGEDAEPAPTPEQALSDSAVLRCCSILSDSLSSVDVNIVHRPPSGGARPVSGIPAAQALADWGYDSKEAFFFNAALLGNSFLTSSLVAIPPWRVSIEIHGDRTLAYRIAPDESINEPERLLEGREVCHLRYRCVGRNNIIGLSPLALAWGSTGAVLATRVLQRSLLKNLARPGLVIKSPGYIQEEEAQRLKAHISELVTGTAKAGTPLLLVRGLEPYELRGHHAEDAQLNESLRFGVAEIARVYGVPLSLLNETSSINYSTAAEETRQFVASTLKPWARRAEDALTHSLLSTDERMAGLSVEFDLSHLTRGSGVEEANYFSTLVGSGLVQLNEARNMLGLEDVSGGDTLRVPVNTQPLDTWLQGQQSQTPQTRANELNINHSMAVVNLAERRIKRMLGACSEQK